MQIVGVGRGAGAGADGMVGVSSVGVALVSRL